MKPEVRLVHRRNGMAGHYGVTVQTVEGAMERCKQIAADLETAHTRIADDQGYPAVEASHADLNRAADRTDVWRGIECRADLVVDHRRAGRIQRFEDRRQLLVHPCRRLSTGDACDADHPRTAEGAEAVSRRRR